MSDHGDNIPNDEELINGEQTSDMSEAANGFNSRILVVLLEPLPTGPSLVPPQLNGVLRGPNYHLSQVNGLQVNRNLQPVQSAAVQPPPLENMRLRNMILRSRYRDPRAEIHQTDPRTAARRESRQNNNQDDVCVAGQSQYNPRP
ncbi:uncharacterized protein LOC115882474 [Sitophilus oryzae]|uniref:Uncharacterized protein LOC115882474 n=1 Tax=Sitophilus oryzae TaxID=7048 RepID=A0A6J2Y050_SITOR|nr:uncharacterized protein LOC115882474 [Sitophilus oryzae]XP_030756405.1 uncharacterized protein LOC115882474 [Sitophilus oryzae]